MEKNGGKLEKYSARYHVEGRLTCLISQSYYARVSLSRLINQNFILVRRKKNSHAELAESKWAQPLKETGPAEPNVLITESSSAKERDHGQ